MSVNTYSKAQDGTKKLSEHFDVREFGNIHGDAIKVDSALPGVLEMIRAYFDKPVIIVSGYRVTGSAGSQHRLGKAADIVIEGVDPRDIAKWCEEHLWAKGIITGLGLYDYKPSDKRGFVHVDVGTGSTRPCQWIQLTSTAGKETVVRSITRDHLGGTAPGGTASAARPTLRQGSRGEDVKHLQGRLIAKGQLVSIDGIFGPATLAAVRAVQQAAGIAVDGIVGAKTWGVLEG